MTTYTTQHHTWLRLPAMLVCQDMSIMIFLLQLPHAMPCGVAAGMKALEWGTGSSTQWTLMRIGHLTSIEHDAKWAPAVRDAVGRTYDAEFLAQVPFI